jgi:hypothetical protein
MAFPQKKKDMDAPTPPDPKKKPALAIAIGIGKPKGAMPPPTMPGGDDDDEDEGMEDGVAPMSAAPAAGVPKGDDADDDTPDPAKMEKAGVIRADHHCQNCENWEADTGNCTVLGPGFAPDDACLRYFEEMGEDSAEDAGAPLAGGDAMGGGGGGSAPPMAG